MEPRKENLAWSKINMSFTETASKIAFSSFKVDKKITLKTIGKCEDDSLECLFDVRDDVNIIMKKDQHNKSIEVNLLVKNEEISSEPFEDFLFVCQTVANVVEPSLWFISTPRFVNDIKDMSTNLSREDFSRERFGLIYSGRIVKTKTDMTYTCKVSTSTKF